MPSQTIYFKPTVLDEVNDLVESGEFDNPSEAVCELTEIGIGEYQE